MMPFQHDFTGTGLLYMSALRDSPARKKGQLCVTAFAPEMSRRAKVS